MGIQQRQSAWGAKGILQFSKLVTQKIGVLMFKYSIHVLPNFIEDLFTSNVSINSYNTGNKSQLRQPRSKYEYMYRNFSYRAQGRI